MMEIKTKDKAACFALKLQYARLWREVFLFPFVSTGNHLVHIVRQMINASQAPHLTVNHGCQPQLHDVGMSLCLG